MCYTLRAIGLFKNGDAGRTHPSLLHFLIGLSFFVVTRLRRKARKQRKKGRGLTRSQIMSRVRSGGNKSTEVRLIELLKRHEVTGWRRRYPLLGNPDFVFPSVRLAVFVDGCFWHGHPRLCRLPATNKHYWIPKIQRNRQRDREVGIALKSRGWRVVRIWEHQLRTKGDQCVRKIQQHM